MHCEVGKQDTQGFRATGELENGGTRAFGNFTIAEQYSRN